MRPTERAPARPSSRAAAPTAERILQSLPIAVLVADAEGRVIFRNQSATRLLQAGDHIEAILPNVLLLEPTEGASNAGEVAPFAGWPMVLRQTAAGQTVQLCCVESPESMLSVQCGPLQGDDHGYVLILVERLASASSADGRPEMSRRLASLGKLAARVAHELNNPLDGILRYINLALRIVGDAPEPKLKAYLSESRTGLMRMVQIIGDLLEYSRSASGEFEETSINEVIEEALRAHSSAAEERQVVVAADFQRASMPKVRGSRLYQVICNLIRNALDAMPRGGRLTITSGIVGNEVVIRVADTGIGLPEPIEQVFEPFFTTKPAGQGTGLGLAICRDFVEDMGGTVSAARGEGGGAVFTVRIPQRAELPMTNYQLPAQSEGNASG